MAGLDHIRSLYDYNAWAKEHVIAEASSCSEGELARELGASFGSVRGNLLHVLWAQGVWLQRFTGGAAAEVPGADAGIGTIREAHAASSDALSRFVAKLTEEDLTEKLAYTDTRGNDFEPPLWQPLVHLVNHGTHHRAGCAMLLTSLGHALRQLDYIFFELERAGAPPRLT